MMINLWCGALTMLIAIINDRFLLTVLMWGRFFSAGGQPSAGAAAVAGAVRRATDAAISPACCSSRKPW
jgi:hypothetical protein